MPRFIEVLHEEWIAAPQARVRAQFADLRHHIDAQVHPKLRFQILQQGASGARYVQEVRLLGLRQRDVFERRFTPEGTMVDTSIEGANKGGSLGFRFEPQARGAAEGTLVQITIRLPLPPVVGRLLAPLLRAQVRREVAAAAAEDKHDLEVRGYTAAPRAAFAAA